MKQKKAAKMKQKKAAKIKKKKLLKQRKKAVKLETHIALLLSFICHFLESFLNSCFSIFYPHSTLPSLVQYLIITIFSIPFIFLLIALLYLVIYFHPPPAFKKNILFIAFFCSLILFLEIKMGEKCLEVVASVKYEIIRNK